MEITTTLGPVTVLAVSGQIDDRTFAELVREAEEALNTGYVRLVVDLGGVDYISSAGLVALHTIARRAAAHDGKTVLCCLDKQVAQVLNLTGFDRTLGIFPDVAAAKASFGMG